MQKNDALPNRRNAIVICDYEISDNPYAENACLFSELLKEIGYESYLIGFGRGPTDTNFTKGNILCTEFGKQFVDARGNKGAVIASLGELLSETEIVIFHSPFCLGLYHTVKRLSVQYRFKLACYICEWHDAKRCFAGRRGIIPVAKAAGKYAVDIYSKRFELARGKNVIVVSRLLENYYSGRGCNCLRIPNLVDIQPFHDRREEDSKIVFGFFGDPGAHNSKDLLINILEGFALLNEDEKKRVEFRIFGVRYEDLHPEYDVSLQTMKSLNGVLRIYGRVPKEQVHTELEKCDFTTLLRENTRSLNCGLSSKMTESMGAGVPLLCNITSNMDEYIQDGVNGVICSSEHPEDMLAGLRRILAMTDSERTQMKKTAYQTARKYFDYKSYTECFGSYIDAVVERN